MQLVRIRTMWRNVAAKDGQGAAGLLALQQFEVLLSSDEELNALCAAHMSPSV